MKKLRTTIFVSSLLLLLLTYIIVCKANQVKILQAQEKLETAINKSYIEENKLDVSTLKDNLEKGANAQILNENATEFPLETIIDGYRFDIQDNGSIQNNTNNTNNSETVNNENEENKSNENNNIEENNTNNNQNDNTVDDDKEEPKDNNSANKPSTQTIVKYSNDTQTQNGITIETKEDGTVTINGKSQTSLFIKISNNIKISSTTNEFETWKQEDGIIIQKDKQIKQKIINLTNIPKEGQLNVVLRTEENQAIGISNLVQNQTEYITTLTQNIIANYIYISKDIEFNNTQFKVQITQEEIESKENKLKLRDETNEAYGVKCTTKEDGTINLMGTAINKIFIKITNGINMVNDGNINSELATQEPSIFKKGEKLNISIKEIGGNCLTINENQEFNVVLKDNEGKIVENMKTKENVLNKEIILEKDITMVYLYTFKDISFENYTIKITVT